MDTVLGNGDLQLCYVMNGTDALMLITSATFRSTCLG